MKLIDNSGVGSVGTGLYIRGTGGDISILKARQHFGTVLSAGRCGYVERILLT